MSQPIQISPFQRRALAVPEEFDLFLGGGRGGGKSYSLALLALRHVEQYAARARILCVRRTYKGLADLELLTRELFGMVYGAAARYNAAEHVWRFPNGAYMELGQIEDESSYQKMQGRSFTLLMVDEAGQFPEPDLLDRLRSNLRGPRDVPIRMVVAANPGGPGHHWLAKRYFAAGEPWRPSLEQTSKRQWVHAPSTFEQNAFIDRDRYHAQLESSCPTDPELLRAWIHGDWAIARGGFFAAVLEESRNAVPRWQGIPFSHGRKWETFLAHDFGSSAPSVTYVVAQSPGDDAYAKFYPRNSLILIDELATNEPGNLTRGMGYTTPILAERILQMCARWKVDPEGVADDACFAKTGHGAGSIAEEFRAAGVYFSPAKKADRLTGWSIMRRLLQNAGKPDVPGLYIARHCEYFWATVPLLGRDPRRVEDVDSRGPDHGADAARYGCLRERQVMELMRISGI